MGVLIWRVVQYTQTELDCLIWETTHLIRSAVMALEMEVFELETEVSSTTGSQYDQPGFNYPNQIVMIHHTEESVDERHVEMTC